MDGTEVTRRQNGTFEKGHRGYGGRPPRAVEEKYLKRLSAKVSIQEWDAIVAKAMEQAKEGDYRAREWLSKYLLPQRLDISQPAMDLALLIDHMANGAQAKKNGRVIDQDPLIVAMQSENGSHEESET